MNDTTKDIILGAISRAVTAVVAFLVLVGVLSWDGETTAAFVVAVEAIVGAPLTILVALRAKNRR
jgi:hypothetical protein